MAIIQYFVHIIIIVASVLVNENDNLILILIGNN